MANNYKLLTKNEISNNLLNKIDSFIMSNNSNGEFINTNRYLNYHNGKFDEDYAVVVNEDSFDIYAFMIGAIIDGCFVSHPGTTFSGLIIDCKQSFEKIEAIVNQLLDYFENKYKKLVIRCRSEVYNLQPNNTTDYILMKREYTPHIKDLCSVINISKIDSEEDLFSQYTSKRRNEVKKSCKNELTFMRKDNIDESIWQKMNTNLKDKYNSRTVHTYEEIRRLKSMFDDNIIPYTVITSDGDYAAFALIYKYKNVYHTQYLDVNYEYAKLYPNLFLIHNIILEARKENCDLFCFGGCTAGENKDINYGLYNYKNDFGGGNALLLEYSKEIK